MTSKKLVIKDFYGASIIYSLSDLKSGEVRKQYNFEDRYLEGRYGTIPYLNTLEDQLLKDLDFSDENAE